MKNLLFSVLSLIAVTATAQEAVKLTAGKINDYGLVYNLPTTVAQIKLHITKTDAKAGPYYKYAQKYLGVNDVVSKDGVAYKLDAIEIVEKGIADPEYSYLVKFRSGSTPSMYLSKEGSLISINAAPETTENASANKKGNKTNSKKPSYSVLNEEQLSAGSTAKMAESAAKQIYRIRESRINIATGDVDQLPADGESFKLIMSQLDEQEAALTEMFLGNINEEKYIETIDYNPALGAGKDVAFRFSNTSGVVDKENLSGDPYYITVDIVEDLRPNDADKKSKDKGKEKGIAYVVPGKVAVSIIHNNKKVKSEVLNISQLGYIKQLPANMFDDKKSPAKAFFDPNTGAVLKIVE